MRRNRDDPLNRFDVVPQLGRAMDPELTHLDRLLDDDVLFQTVRADWLRRYPQTATRGRHSTPVEVILRMLVVKRPYCWSYEEAEHFVGDSLVSRRFCRVYLERVPADTPLIRWAKMVGPTTLEQPNERGVQLARSLEVTRGRKRRLDSAVVETNIHHPTDSGLLGAGVRVVSRLLRRARALIGAAPDPSKTAFRSHTRSVRRLAQQLRRVARRKGEEAVAEMKGTYARLLAITQGGQVQARKVCTVVRRRSEGEAQRLARQFEVYPPRIDQAVAQTVRRVIDGDMVPAQGKIVSLFEPHPQVIVRHKTGKAVEFGRKLRLAEVEHGTISGYRVLEEPGQD